MVPSNALGLDKRIFVITPQEVPSFGYSSLGQRVKMTALTLKVPRWCIVTRKLGTRVEILWWHNLYRYGLDTSRWERGGCFPDRSTRDSQWVSLPRSSLRRFALSKMTRDHRFVKYMDCFQGRLMILLKRDIFWKACLDISVLANIQNAAGQRRKRRKRGRKSKCQASSKKNEIEWRKLNCVPKTKLKTLGHTAEMKDILIGLQCIQKPLASTGRKTQVFLHTHQNWMRNKENLTSCSHSLHNNRNWIFIVKNWSSV